MPHFAVDPSSARRLAKARPHRAALAIVLLFGVSLGIAVVFVIIAAAVAFLVSMFFPWLPQTRTLLGVIAGVAIGFWVAGRMLRIPVRMGLTPGSRWDRIRAPRYPRRER